MFFMLLDSFMLVSMALFKILGSTCLAEIATVSLLVFESGILGLFS